MASSVETYVSRIVTLLGAIEYDSTTLSAAGLVQAFKRSARQTPNTIVSVFERSLSSAILESKVNKREYLITIRIETRAVNREEQAQNDLYELEESIVQVLEQNLGNTDWGDGYLDNFDIQTFDILIDENYYTKDIPVVITKRVSTNN